MTPDFREYWNTIKRNTDIKVDDDRMAWSANWLGATKKRDIRKRLDEVFAEINQKYIRDPDQPLTRQINTPGSFQFYPGLSPIEQLAQVCAMCHELSARLDQGDTSMVRTVGTVMQQLPLETVLFSVRRYIQIERLVKYNLDEDPIFGPALTKVNRAVDA